MKPFTCFLSEFEAEFEIVTEYTTSVGDPTTRMGAVEFFEYIRKSSQSSLTFASNAKKMFTKTGGLSNLKH
jgi:hypothetical protein